MTKAKRDKVYRITFKLYGDGVVNVTAPSGKEALRIFKEESGSDPRIEGLGHDIRREGCFTVKLDAFETEQLHKSSGGK